MRIRLVVMCVGLAGAALPAAVHATPLPSPPALAPQTTSHYSVRAVENFLIPTRGGNVFVRLSRPNTPADVKVPVILTYTPYALLGASATDATGGFFVKKGYARAVADVIGTGNSGGCWDYGGKREQDSAYDLVEFLGTQTWSNGKVAMIGGSYDGTTANMAAVAQPPHLTTIVPEVAISDWYGYAYHDGVRYFVMDPAQRQGTVIDEQGFDTPVSFDAAEGMAPPQDRTNPVTLAQRAIERPCPGMTDKIVHTQRGYDLDPVYDEFWRQRGYINDAAKLGEANISVLVQGGWRDYNVKHSESSRWYDAIPVDDPNTPADEGVPFKMLIMGQEAHGGSDIGDFQKTLHAWFDYFLSGYDGTNGKADTNITKQLPSISRTNDGVVHTDADWPPPTTASAPLYLRASGALSSVLPGADEGSSSFVDTGRMTESDALSLRDSTSNEVLWFTSPTLTSDVRVAGMPVLDATASTLGTSTQFTPVLFDFGPPVSTTPSLCTFTIETNACVISRGFLNARNRESLSAPTDLTPGAEYRARVRFIDNDWVVKAGHRIGIAIMSSNAWWALPDQERALNTIAHDLARPSALVLPIVGGQSAASAAGL